MKKGLIIALGLMAGPLSAQEVSLDDGLAAWDRIYAVASHPRCTNCHVGAQEAPMWNGLRYGEGVKHGQNIKADESRIGAESVPCRTCHVTAAGRDVASPAPPQIEEAWRLPPVELAWLGKGSPALCAQLRDPEQNDGHDVTEMVAHIRSSPFVAWGFQPGPGRSKPDGTLADLAQDVALWGAAGHPCR